MSEPPKRIWISPLNGYEANEGIEDPDYQHGVWYPHDISSVQKFSAEYILVETNAPHLVDDLVTAERAAELLMEWQLSSTASVWERAERAEPALRTVIALHAQLAATQTLAHGQAWYRITAEAQLAAANARALPTMTALEAAMLVPEVAAMRKAATVILKELRANRFASDHMPEASRVELSRTLDALPKGGE